MKILHHPDELSQGPGRVCIAIGVFDGVHLGHQQVIRQAITDASHLEASSLVVTFDRHPNTIVAPGAVPLSIQTLDQKLEAIERLGVDATLVLPFDKALSRLRAERFIEQLMTSVRRLFSICVGQRFTFGYKRGGNVSLLRSLGDAHGFRVHGLAAVSLDGRVVSSTRIREAIRDGNLDLAGQMLGRDYKIRGDVVRGDALGRKLGFPTANINVIGTQVPPSGVYAVHMFRKGITLRGVANIGRRPTVSTEASEIRLEVHLLDFGGDLYNDCVDIQFLKYMRPEMKFSSVEELSTQIEADVQSARDHFALC